MSHNTKHALALVVAILVFLWLIKAPVMSVYLSSKLGVTTTVRMISMWPSETTIRYFRIANPEGYGLRSALTAKKVKLNYSWGALTGNPREIDLITLDNVHLNIDIKNLSDNNWATIGARMPDTRKSREVIVHKLVLTNMTVKVEGAGAKGLGIQGTRHFDQMEFNEINSKDGFPTKELVSKIFQGAGLERILQDFLNPIRQIKDVLNPFNLFGKKSPRIESEGSQD